MFDIFKDNDEIVAAILASAEIQKYEVCDTLNDLRSRIVSAWSYYSKTIKEERNKLIQEKYNEISKLGNNF